MPRAWTTTQQDRIVLLSAAGAICSCPPAALWTLDTSLAVFRHNLSSQYHSLANRHSCSAPGETRDWKCFSLHLILVVGNVDMINQPCRYCFYSVVQKCFFCHEAVSRCPINVKFGFPIPNFSFIGAKMWEYSPPNCQNFEFWPEICISGATRLQYFYEILSVCTRL